MFSKKSRPPGGGGGGVGGAEAPRGGAPQKTTPRPWRGGKPTREIGRSANEDRIIRLRQPNDRLVKAGQLCCFNDLLQIGITEPRDDVLYGFSEEIDILRQISEKPTAA